jgi:peptidase M28-like protein
MDSKSSGAVLRLVVLALVAVAIWSLGAVLTGEPVPRGLDAPATDFSAARADLMLARLLGPEVPHPVSSAANRAVRDRIRAAFAKLGVPTIVYRAPGCTGRAQYGFFACGMAEDIVADVVPGEGKAVVLVAHYDSVPAGPGASDDQSGVATILETVRALKARHIRSRHPVIAAITDGEEAGLLGASSFLDNAGYRDRVGVAINVEARGNQGPSLLFQTSPGDGRLIDLYAGAVPEYATSSLFAVIYKALPNDTDLTIFLNHGLTGYNFAFSGNVAHYHTPLDRRENLSLSTLQMHGDNALGVASALMTSDFAALKGGDDVYLTVFGHLLPRLPADWVLPLVVAAVLLFAFAGWAMRREEVLGVGRRLAALAILPAAVLGAALTGWLLHEIATLVSGQPDPSYAHPLWLRIALAFGVAAVLAPLSRVSSAPQTARAVWYWYGGVALATAVFLPGLSPYFLFPMIVAAIVLAAQIRFPSLFEAALFVAALPALIVWLSLSALGEQVQGLALHPLFTVPIAFGAVTLLPLLASRPLSRRGWMRAMAVCGALAIAFAVIAGLMPAYSTRAPQRLNIDFVDDHVANKAQWVIETGAPLPPPLNRIMPFVPAQGIPLLRQAAFAAPAGAPRFAVPTVSAQRRGVTVSLTVHASSNANRVAVIVPKEAGLVKASMFYRTFTASKDNLNPAGTILACVTDDCRTVTITLTFGSDKPAKILVGEQQYGLPADGAKLQAARPRTATAQQSGDTTVVFGKVTL